MRTYAILGIGNSLLSDDGIGIHVVRELAAANTDNNVHCLDAGTIGLSLVSEISAVDGLIAIDAMRLDKAPGSITVLEGPSMDAHLRKQSASVHELGLADMVDALRLMNSLPAQRALVGMEPQSLDWGTEPTPAVRTAITNAVTAVTNLLSEWRAAQRTESAA